MVFDPILYLEPDVEFDIIIYLSIKHPELHVFWPLDIEGRIKLTFSEVVSLFLKTRLMTLLTMPLETSKCSRVITFNLEFLLRKRYIGIINKPAIAAMHGPHSVLDICHSTVIRRDVGGVSLADQ